jgi:hypothetical protein
MQRTNFIANWETFTVVAQDKPGTIINGSGGLITSNLSNCICVILTDGGTKFGMIHVAPHYPDLKKWLGSLRENVGATDAIIAGANIAKQPQERIDVIEEALHGINIVDETRTGWIENGMIATRGTNTLMCGVICVSATTGEYAMETSAFAATANPAKVVKGTKRGSADGGCTIL